MEIVKLPLADLEMNVGQIPELPMNPRQWTQTDIDRLAVSIKETPELFEARPLLVIPHEGKFIILGGNLRFEASRQNKAEKVPAIIFPPDTPVSKLKEIVIKDNGSFGEWDYDALANEWDDLALSDWGVPTWGTSSRGDVEKEIEGMIVEQGNGVGKSNTGFQSFTFVFTQEEASVVTEYIKKEGKEKLQAEIVELCRNVEAK